MSEVGVRAALTDATTRRWVLAALAAALVVRVLAVLATTDSAPQHDSLDYHLLAVSLHDGNGYGNALTSLPGRPSAFRAPLYPAFLFVTYEVAGVSVTAARLLQAALGLATVALLGALVLRFWGRRTALVAMGIAAVYPPLVVGSVGGLISEALFVPLTLGALLCVFAHRNGERGRRWWWLVGAGACLGSAMLTREAGLFLVPGIGLALLGPDLRRRWRAVLAAVATVAVSAAVVIAPWTIRNARTLDAFVPVSTSRGMAVAGTYNDTARLDRLECLPGYEHLCGRAAWINPLSDPDVARTWAEAGTEPASDRALRDFAVDYALDHPGYVVEVAFWNTVRLFDGLGLAHSQQVWTGLGVPRSLATAAFFGFVALVPLALVGLTSGRLRLAPLALWLIPVAVGAATVLVYGTARYRAPIEPFLVVLAALGVERLLERRARKAPA